MIELPGVTLCCVDTRHPGLALDAMQRCMAGIRFADYVSRPDVVLSGHVHQPPFKPDGAWADRIGDTWVFNPGKQSGPIPTHVELDIEPGPGPTRGFASWWSIMGREEIDLSSPVTPPRTLF